MVDQAVTEVAKHMDISKAKNRIWSIRGEYSQAEIAAGYGDITRTKPHIAINHFLKKSKPFQLKLDMMASRKNEHFQKTKLDMFVREVAVEAKTIQNEQRTALMPQRHMGKDPIIKRKTFNAEKRKAPQIQ